MRRWHLRACGHGAGHSFTHPHLLPPPAKWCECALEHFAQRCSTCKACSSKKIPRLWLPPASAAGTHASTNAAPPTPKSPKGEDRASCERVCDGSSERPLLCTGKQSLTSQNLPPSSCNINASPAPPQPLTSSSVRACSHSVNDIVL